MRLQKWIAAASIALAPVVAMAAYTPGAGITGTPHDWATNGAGATKTTTVLQWLVSAGADPTVPANITTYNTGFVYTNPATGKQGTTALTLGLCTKCHTPHKAKSTNLLWNHTLSTNNFTWDQPATTAGTPYPQFKGDTYKGSTTKCLSCHDGSLASTDGVWFNRQSISGSKYVGPTGPGTDSGHEIGVGGNMSGTHPVAMPYPYGGSLNTYNSVANGAGTVLAEFVADPTAVGIKLFNDDGSGNITSGPVAGKSGFECNSCHDVHNGSQTKDQLLLRGMMSGGKAQGYICTQCHSK
jgi:hypothetical protein